MLSAAATHSSLMPHFVPSKQKLKKREVVGNIFGFLRGEVARGTADAAQRVSAYMNNLGKLDSIFGELLTPILSGSQQLAQKLAPKQQQQGVRDAGNAGVNQQLIEALRAGRQGGQQLPHPHLGGI